MNLVGTFQIQTMTYNDTACEMERQHGERGIFLQRVEGGQVSSPPVYGFQQRETASRGNREQACPPKSLTSSLC
jgi:hypothetical protein